MPTGYWQARKHLAYYGAVREELEALSPGGSLLDVGGWDTEVVQWGTFARRYTCDLGRDPGFPGVVAHVGDFLEWPLPERMSVTTCCQVLEHMDLDTARRFAAKLLAGTDVLIITVPHQWPPREPSHILDPIDLPKLASIVRYHPLRHRIIADGKRERLVAIYDTRRLGRRA